MGNPPRNEYSLRVVEDHHVDRPGVEAQQCVELTGTNSSIGLIVLINQCSFKERTIHVPDLEV